jgi:transaldolase
MLAEAGQSAWLDNINRPLLESGRLNAMIAMGLRGLTSNPTIFEKALSGSAYDKALNDCVRRGMSAFEIYDELTVADIQAAADAFLPVYESTAGTDGYVSLEINPLLAHRTEETISEGRRLARKVCRPNLMLKVPATDEGFPAIEQFLAEGLNVNVTLIFSSQQYEDTVAAYLSGISRCIAGGRDPGRVRSVASVFVSRFDTAVDAMLETMAVDTGARDTLLGLQGTAAVAHMSRIYELFRASFASPEFVRLQKAGAAVQRVLWASTSTKDPRYSDIKYVTELVAPDTVNTMPQATFEAFLDHGSAQSSLGERSRQTLAALERLRGYGIDIETIGMHLQRDGVQSFVRSFEALLASIEKKAAQVQQVR